MSHANDCITKSCMGCGPEADVDKLKKKLAMECERNNTLLDELIIVKDKLKRAEERIRELEDKGTL